MDDLRSLIVPAINIADSNLISGGIIIKLPTMVKSMTKPNKPREPKYPSLRETTNSLGYMLLPKAVLKHRADKLYKRRYNNYEKHLQTYEKRLKLYEKNAEVYENANRINEDIERNFYLYLDTLIQQMEHKKATLAKAYGIYRWNYAVNAFIKKNNSDSLFDSNLANSFMNICNSKPNEQLHKELFLTDYDLQLLKGLKWTSFQKMQGIMKSGVLDFDKNREHYVRKLRYNINTWYATSVNQFALEKFQEGKIRAVFSKVNPNGSFAFAQNAVVRSAPSSNTYYVASVTNLGYINCDRFYNYRPNEMMVLNIKKQHGEAVVLYIDKYRSLLYPNYSTMETVQFSIPKTAAAKILVNGLASGLPTFQIIDITRNKDITAYQTDAKEVLLSQMEKMLREL